MPIQQGRDMRLSSAADPLPTRFRRTLFPLSPVSAKSHSND